MSLSQGAHGSDIIGHGDTNNFYGVGGSVDARWGNYQAMAASNDSRHNNWDSNHGLENYEGADGFEIHDATIREPTLEAAGIPQKGRGLTYHQGINGIEMHGPGLLKHPLAAPPNNCNSVRSSYVQLQAPNSCRSNYTQLPNSCKSNYTQLPNSCKSNYTQLPNSCKSNYTQLPSTCKSNYAQLPSSPNYTSTPIPEVSPRSSINPPSYDDAFDVLIDPPAPSYDGPQVLDYETPLERLAALYSKFAALVPKSSPTSTPGLSSAYTSDLPVSSVHLTSASSPSSSSPILASGDLHEHETRFPMSLGGLLSTQGGQAPQDALPPANSGTLSTPAPVVPIAASSHISESSSNAGSSSGTSVPIVPPFPILQVPRVIVETPPSGAVQMLTQASTLFLAPASPGKLGRSQSSRSLAPSLAASSTLHLPENIPDHSKKRERLSFGLREKMGLKKPEKSNDG